jgi:hypothetical protein
MCTDVHWCALVGWRATHRDTLNIEKAIDAVWTTPCLACCTRALTNHYVILNLYSLLPVGIYVGLYLLPHCRKLLLRKQMLFLTLLAQVTNVQ